MTAKGVQFERYGPGLGQDERRVARQDPPPTVWFRHPSGNILLVVEQGD